MYVICMEYVWQMYGACIEYVWNMYGICMEYVWNTYKIYVWNMYGICMEYAWNICVTCMEFVRNLPILCSSSPARANTDANGVSFVCRFSTEEPWPCGDVELWRQKHLEYVGDVYGAWMD